MALLTRLLQQLCAGMEREDAERIVGSGSLSIGGISMSLHPAGDVDPDGVHILCGLGPLPTDPSHAASALHRLLLLNAHLFVLDRDAPTFALDGQTGDALLMARQSLPGLTADRLQAALMEMASLAEAWRETQLADAAPLQPDAARPVAAAA